MSEGVVKDEDLLRYISDSVALLRTVLGEPLFIWWFSRSLSNRNDKKYWKMPEDPLSQAMPK